HGETQVEKLLTTHRIILQGVMADGIKTVIEQGYAPNSFEDVTVQDTPKGTPQSGSRIHQTTLAYAPNNAENKDEPIHQNPMGITKSGSMARQTTLGKTICSFHE
ncbi:hypothetical protein Tco_1023033, partial [Tanacetum coccineum]